MFAEHALRREHGRATSVHILWCNERERTHPALEYFAAFEVKFHAAPATLDAEAAALAYTAFQFPETRSASRYPKIASWLADVLRQPSTRPTEPRYG